MAGYKNTKMKKVSKQKARETTQITNGVSPLMFSNSSCLYLTVKKSTFKSSW